MKKKIMSVGEGDGQSKELKIVYLEDVWPKILPSKVLHVRAAVDAKSPVCSVLLMVAATLTEKYTARVSQ